VTVRFGILSTARINELVLAGARKSDRVRMVAVGSRDLARAEAYAREHGLERAYGSYEGLLDDPDLDAIYISLPNSGHIPWTIRALRAGKHVLCEKPLTRHADEAEEAFDVAEQEGRLLMEAFMWLHNPQIRRLQELISEGAVGTVKLIRAVQTFVADDPRDIRLLADLDGGSLMDVGCYCVHAARHLAGEPERAYGEPVRNAAGVDISFAGTLLCPNGILAQITSSLVLPEIEELEIVGDQARLVLTDPWHGWVAPRIELRRDGEVEELRFEPTDPYQLELENLSAAILGEVEPLLGRADAVAQARTLEALFQSAISGAPIDMSVSGYRV
jgi:D-xylose 1-dehydrogenase (NADP+, D-xylono-1,5-lactone-forming)